MALPQFLFSIGGIIALVFVVYTAHNIAHLLLRLFCTYSTFIEFSSIQKESILI
jgi:hypothetical protein